MTSPAILTRELRKSYGAKEVVRGLNLEVGQGEVFGFLGPNGAGKSTTVKMLLGLVTPSSGERLVLGGSPDDPRIRAQLGFLPEQFRFQTWMTGHEFLNLHGRLAGLGQADIRTRVPQVLERVGLAGRGGELISGYSKGMVQRLGLASALLARPRLVFLDEPTSALDPIGRVEVRHIIEDLRAEGVSVFLNSHLLSEVSQVCDQVAFVRQGQVLQQGSMADIMGGDLRLHVRLDAVTPERLAALQQFGPVLEQHADRLELGLTSADQVPEVARRLLDLGAAIYELTPAQPDLESIFLRLIQRSGDAAPATPASHKEPRHV